MGATGGGVWKTTDAGTTWQNISDGFWEVPRPRGREIDLAIAACALSWRASLWTLNGKDFGDLPGLRLLRP